MRPSPTGTELPRPLAGAVLVQARVVRALVLREIQARYGRGDIGYLWALVEPLMLLGVFLLLFTFTGRRSHAGMELVPFLGTGIIVFLSLRDMVRAVSSAVEANRGLLLYPQVTPFDAIVARSVLQVATFLVVFLVITGGAVLLGYASLPADPFGVLVALLAAAGLGVALGLLQQALTMLLPILDHAQRVLWRVLMFTSCVFFTMKDLPIAAQEATAYNPIAHVIEQLRAAYFIAYETPIDGYGYVLAWILAASTFGLLMERSTRDRTKAQ
jgi:capsular polysaccharide transport system permease protein